MATKRKTTTAIVAGVTAAALLLGGTFAWTSISQQAKNEAIVDINPGGRLHDDFNGTNKDVYVENFSSGATGVDIFARIRLDQYFEVGQDAGINKKAGDRKVNQILGTDINDVTKWETFKPVDEEGDFIDLSDLVQANGNWQWTLGNDDTNLPYYMPTFNMNKDSLAADINGTYEGTVEGDIVHYDDYVVYVDADGNPKTATGTEVYDWDDEDNEEETDPTITYDETTPRDDADVYHKEGQTHTAAQISTTAEVISMAQWLERLSDDDDTNDTGAFWVYDTDGWAYWAQAIAPQTTTGLLLDGISMSKVPDDNYYYGINVVGQFATAGDWELLYSTGDDKDAMTENAQTLMELITNVASSEDDDNTPQTLTLTPAGGLVYAEIGEAINITYDITGYEDDVESTPNISTVTVTYDVFDDSNDGQAVPTPLTTDQYTYTYDTESGTGTLTITDSNLDGYYLTVNDSNGEVRGDIDLSTPSSEPEFVEDGTLTLRVDGADTETVAVGTELPVKYDATDDYQPDISEIKVTVSVYNEETEEYDEQTLTAGEDYSYSYDSENDKGTLIILNTTLEGERLNVEDKTGVAYGDVDVTTKDITYDDTLTLNSASSDIEDVTVGTGITVEFDTTGLDPDAEDYEAPDPTGVILSYTTYEDENDEEGTTVIIEDTRYTYTYDDESGTGTLTLTDDTLMGDLLVTDNNGVLKGEVSITSEDDETPGSGSGEVALIEVNDADAGYEMHFGAGAEFTVSTADTIDGASVESAQLGIVSQPEGVTVTDNQDGTFTVKIADDATISEGSYFVFTASGTVNGETVNDTLQITLNPDLRSNGINIYLPSGYSGAMSPGFGGTFTASDSDVTWSISDNQSDDTTINASTGFVTIGNNETAETIKLTATSNTDSNLYGTYNLTILTDGMLSITATTTDGTTKLVAKDVREDIQTNFTDTYTWTVSPESGLTVAEDGTLTATTAGIYTVTATSISNSRVTATIEVTVNDDFSITVPTTETTEPTE